jgi:hypothetical protein
MLLNRYRISGIEETIVVQVAAYLNRDLEGSVEDAPPTPA